MISRRSDQGVQRLDGLRTNCAVAFVRGFARCDIDERVCWTFATVLPGAFRHLRRFGHAILKFQRQTFCFDVEENRSCLAIDPQRYLETMPVWYSTTA